MEINSWSFLFLVFLIGLLNLTGFFRERRVLLICTVNLTICSLFKVAVLPPLIFYTAATYLSAMLVRDKKFKGSGTVALIVFILLSIGLFIIFKTLPDLQLKEGLTLRFLIPIGFSYICLQNIGFVLDTRNRSDEKFPNPFEFFACSTFFANILSGPIANLYSLKDDIVRNQATALDVRYGIARIANGFFKKSISDVISLSLLFPYDGKFIVNAKIYFVSGLLLKFYLDFSGYVDIAVGAARVLGIKLPENFDRPYSSVTIAEYWNRWHMTLGAWFKHYFFYPLQIWIFRKVRVSDFVQIALVNAVLFTTFVAIGLWHGINAKYFLWGIFNAFFVVLSNWIIRIRFLFGYYVGGLVFGSITLFLIFTGQLLLMSLNYAGFLKNFSDVFSLSANNSVSVAIATILGILLFIVHQFDAKILNPQITESRYYPALLSALIVMAIIIHQNGGAFLYAAF